MLSLYYTYIYIYNIGQRINDIFENAGSVACAPEFERNVSNAYGSGPDRRGVATDSAKPTPKDTERRGA